MGLRFTWSCALHMTLYPSFCYHILLYAVKHFPLLITCVNDIIVGWFSHFYEKHIRIFQPYCNESNPIWHSNIYIYIYIIKCKILFTQDFKERSGVQSKRKNSLPFYLFVVLHFIFYPRLKIVLWKENCLIPKYLMVLIFLYQTIENTLLPSAFFSLPTLYTLYR